MPDFEFFMELPDYVLPLLSRLESGGYSAYVVGGCVRDACLGLEPHDYDMCTSADPQQIKALFADYPMYLAGEKHGTISVISHHRPVEITAYRTEGSYSDNRHPDQVHFVTHIREDLARRDFTVNAMAWSPKRGLADPFGGRQDLQARILRTVGSPCERFQEDALRILRGVRFAVRFGLTPEPETFDAMVRLAPLTEHLARERVFDELWKLLPLVTAQDLLHFAPILTQVIPELAPCLGFDQHNPHHAFDVYTHTAHVTEAVPQDPALRWAALLHDAAKPELFFLDEAGIGHFYGHEKRSAQMADQILRRLKAPTALRETVVWLIGQHMTPLTPDRKLLRRRLRQHGPERVRQLLALQTADRIGTGVPDPKASADLEEVGQILEDLAREDACFCLSDLAVTGTDLLEIGFQPGKALGQCLNDLLTLVVEEVLPNQKQDLLKEAKKKLEETT